MLKQGGYGYDYPFWWKRQCDRFTGNKRADFLITEKPEREVTRWTDEDGGQPLVITIEGELAAPPEPFVPDNRVTHLKRKAKK